MLAHGCDHDSELKSLGFGHPASLLAMVERVDRLAALVSMAGSAARAWPDNDDELDSLRDEAQTTATVLRLHLRAASDRMERRQLSAERAIEAAENRGRRILAGLHQAALANSFEPHGYFVYCLWGDSDETPLYVGLSTNVLARLGSHLGDRSKRPYIQRVTLQRFDTERQMIAAEARLIAEYQPTWNVVGRFVA